MFYQNGWKKSFGMTASMPVDASVDVTHCQQEEDLSETKKRESNLILHPSNFTLTDIENQKKENTGHQKVHIEDTKNLFQKLQVHRCNAYCMRKRNHW